MDLGRCPRCGADWPTGLERCNKCGYVPIGAGVKAEKKPRRRVGKYVEPGSSRGFVFICLFGVLAFGCWKYHPWENDWALVRYWMGQGRVQDVRGEWDVVKSVAVKPSASALVANKYSGGRLKFSEKENFSISLRSGEKSQDGAGRYRTDGRLVHVESLKPTDGSAQLPTNFSMTLTWTGPDMAMGAIGGNEILYLRRKKKDQGLLKMFRFGLKPDADTKVPGAMRGIIANMKDQMDKAE